VIDKNDEDGVEGEDDLLKVTLYKPLSKTPATDVVTLSWPDTPLRVYTKPDRTGRINTGHAFTVATMPDEVDLYAEGWAVQADLSLRADYSTAGASCSDVVELTVVGADLSYVYFVSDHGVLTDWTTNFTDAGGTVFAPRGWRRAPPANNPVSHTQGIPVTARVAVTISPAGQQFRLIGTCGIAGLDFTQAIPTTSTGAAQVVQIASTVPLDAKVQVLEPPIKWKVQFTNSVPLGESGPHKVYVTWGAPGEGPTLKRVGYVCTEAQGAGSPEAAADDLHAALAGEIVLGLGNEHGWELLDGGSGDCDNLAYCMLLCVEMLGAGPSIVANVRASEDGGAGNCLSQDDRPGPPHQWLVLDFDLGAGYAWNAYESCCVTAGQYYAIHPTQKAGDDYQMLLALPCQQYWAATVDDKRPGDEGWTVIEPPIEEQPKP
jgi:hypothetical protein